MYITVSLFVWALSPWLLVEYSLALEIGASYNPFFFRRWCVSHLGHTLRKIRNSFFLRWGVTHVEYYFLLNWFVFSFSTSHLCPLLSHDASGLCKLCLRDTKFLVFSTQSCHTSWIFKEIFSIEIYSQKPHFQKKASTTMDQLKMYRRDSISIMLTEGSLVPCTKKHLHLTGFSSQEK